MDYVFIKGLRLKAYIGLHDWEQGILQTLLVDLKMWIHPARQIDAQPIVNYQQVAERLQAFVSERHCVSVEQTAEQMATQVLEEFAVEKLQLKLTKPNVFAHIDGVGVVIKRSRRQHP